MSNYQVRVVSPSGGSDDGIFFELEAKTRYEALMLAQQKCGSRPSELWQGDRRLARIRNVGSRDTPVWQVE
jgi:hypothetical protein